MNAIRLLLRQHDEIEALLRNLAKADEEGPRAREEYLRQLTVLLHGHLQIEEEIFYPAVAEQGTPALVEASIREHEQCRELLARLRDTRSGEGFRPRLRALEDAFIQHAGDEEVDLFPEVKSLFGAQDLEDLGMRMEESFESFLTAPMEEAPAQPPAAQPAAAEHRPAEPLQAEAGQPEAQEPSGPLQG